MRGTGPNNDRAQRSGGMTLCFFFAGSIMKIGVVNVCYKEKHGCFCHIQSVIPGLDDEAKRTLSYMRSGK